MKKVLLLALLSIYIGCSAKTEIHSPIVPDYSRLKLSYFEWQRNISNNDDVWYSKPDSGLSRLSPEEITKWAISEIKELEDLENERGISLLFSKFNILARALVTLRNKNESKLARIYIIETSLDMMYFYKQGPLAGVGMQLKTFVEDYPMEDNKYAVLLVRYALAQKEVILNSALIFLNSINAFSEENVVNMELGAKRALYEDLESIYDANQDNRGGALAAIYLVKLSSDINVRKEGVRKDLIEKYRDLWFKDDEFLPIVAKELEGI